MTVPTDLAHAWTGSAKASAKAVGALPPAPSLDDCLGAPSSALSATSDLVSDPHGQGDLLGFGFHLGKVFVRIDRVDLTGVVTAGGQPVTDVAVSSHALVGRVTQDDGSVPLANTAWNGAVFNARLRCPNPAFEGATRRVQVRLTDALPGPPIVQTLGAPATPVAADGLPPGLYHFDVLLEDGRVFAESCADPDDRSFALPGYWDPHGDFVRDGARFAVGCVKRGAAWCLHQGYLDDGNEFDDKFLLFEACGRMMRADYCGDGKTYTQEHTMITMWDRSDLPATSSFEGTFEAAWNARGMVCKSHPRWSWSKVGGKPACWDPAPACASDVAALGFGNPATLLFNASCKEEAPCTGLPQRLRKTPAPAKPGLRAARGRAPVPR